MNSLVIGAAVLLFLWLGYHFYGRLIDRRIVNPDPSAKTPAEAQYDGVDFVPARRAMLFGHHFSSIAGAGPIVGPIIAVFHFGWLAAIGWIALGAVFIGGVHDYLTLMTSVRHRGASIADIAQDMMGKRAKLIFSAFLWLALILIITVFALLAAKTLVERPEIVLPALALIPLAILVGWLVYRRGVPIYFATIIGLAILVLFIYLGNRYPLELPVVSNQVMGWFAILIVYCLFASVLPVWFLLQPRDYLSSYILFIGLGIGFIGLAFSRPTISAPMVTSLSTAQGPIWPMLFVIVACGAISGFHSLVASGTSSKQLTNEIQGKFIGYGGMLYEGALATLALLAVSGGLAWSNFTSIMAVKGRELVAFGEGFGSIVSAIPHISLNFARPFGFIMVNAFILTTLDTATRLARFIVAESAGKKLSLLKNRWVATLITLLPAAYLGFTGQWKAIWPVFGAANQLIAALALVVISTYLVGIRKPTRFTLIPAIFMLLTTIGALAFLSFNRANGFLFGKEPKFLLGCISLILIVLAIFIVAEARRLFGQLMRS